MLFSGLGTKPVACYRLLADCCADCHLAETDVGLEGRKCQRTLYDMIFYQGIKTRAWRAVTHVT